MTGGWPKWHADLANSGRSSSDTSKLDGGVAWTVAIGAAGTSATFGYAETYNDSPAVAADGTIYQVSMSGLLYAISPAGAALWEVQLTDTSADCYPSTPAIRADGTLVVLTGQDYAAATTPTQQLFVVSSSGSVLFSEVYGEDGFDAPPSIGTDGTVLLASDDGSGGTDPYSAMAWTVQSGNLGLYAGANFGTIGSGAGEEELSVALTSGEESYWAVNGQYFALTAPTQGFTVPTGWPALGVTVANGSADSTNVLGVSSSRVAVDTKTTGYVIAYTGWEDSPSLFGPPYSIDGSLTALDPGSGAVKWALTLPVGQTTAAWVQLNSDSGNAAPAIGSDGTLYVGAGTGLLSVNGTTGVVNWTFASANVSSSPAIGGDGTVFFGCDDGSFYAVTPGATSGTQRFKVTTGGPVSSSPAIGPNGEVYFVSDDGNLYAIH
jgi:outer membrane protein assembly factor BamB